MLRPNLDASVRDSRFTASQIFRRFAREFRRSTQDVLAEAQRSPERAGLRRPIVSAGLDKVAPLAAWPDRAGAIARAGPDFGCQSLLTLPRALWAHKSGLARDDWARGTSVMQLDEGIGNTLAWTGS